MVISIMFNDDILSNKFQTFVETVAYFMHIYGYRIFTNHDEWRRNFAPERTLFRQA